MILNSLFLLAIKLSHLKACSWLRGLIILCAFGVCGGTSGLLCEQSFVIYERHFSFDNDLILVLKSLLLFAVKSVYSMAFLITEGSRICPRLEGI